MDPHGVKIFYGADDNDIVFCVTHDLEFVFLPPQDRLFDENFARHTLFQATCSEVFKFFHVVNQGTTGAAHGIAGANHHGKPDIPDNGTCFFHGAGNAAPRDIKSDLCHRFLELISVFSPFDRLQIGADHFNPVFFKYTPFGNFDGDVQGSLTPDRRQDRIGTFLPHDFFNNIRRNRLYVSMIRHLRIRHDGCGIRIKKNDLISLFPKCLAGLCTGIIKFAGLSDDNRTGPDDENLFQIRSFGHIFNSFDLPPPDNSCEQRDYRYRFTSYVIDTRLSGSLVHMPASTPALLSRNEFPCRIYRSSIIPTLSYWAASN